MFNELRSWLRPSEGRENVAERDGHRRSLCYVLDEEVSSGQMLTGILKDSGLDTEWFANSPAFIEGLAQGSPDVVFMDVAAEANQAIDALFTLGEQSFRGPVQLMGGQASTTMETVQRMGERHSLRMLPLLRKPFETQTIRQILVTHKLTGPPQPAKPQQIDLSEAIAKDWIEFWYQPKIDLSKKQLAGVETFARVRHPELGMLQPGAFMPGADEKSLTQLTERALVGALTTATALSNLGIHLRLAVNISAAALVSLPVAAMVRQLGPKRTAWPGLILDVTEAQIAPELALVRAVAERLAADNIKLAIDDFGSGQLSIANLRELSFAELKLDRAFVTNCGTSKSNAAVCKAVIDLAHNFGCVAVAIGVEYPADVHALQAMGCDVGQGFLFGQPMPEERLIAMLRERAVRPKRHAPNSPDRAAAR